MSMGAFSLALALTRLLPFLNDDQDIVAAPDDVELFQPQPSVADAFAGLQLVFITVPRADEMNLVRERLALVGAVRRNHVDHAVDHEPLAGRPAGMDAGVAVGEVSAVLVEHADFRVSSDDDAAIAVLHLGRLGHEAFRHGGSSLARTLAWRRCDRWRKSVAPGGIELGSSRTSSLWPQRRAQRWESFDPSRAARIAPQTRCGVAGVSMCSMPIPESASSTAFMSTAELGVMPASPPPLTRSALPLVGSSVNATSRCGR